MCKKLSLFPFLLQLFFLPCSFFTSKCFCSHSCFFLCNPASFFFRIPLLHNLCNSLHKLCLTITLSQLISSNPLLHIKCGKCHCFIRHTNLPAIHKLQTFHQLLKRIHERQQLIYGIPNQLSIGSNAHSILGILIHQTLFHPIFVRMLLGKQIHLTKAKTDALLHYPLFRMEHHLPSALVLTALLPLTRLIMPSALLSSILSDGINDHVNVHILTAIMTIGMHCHHCLMSRCKCIQPLLAKFQCLLHSNRIIWLKADNIMMCLHILYGIILAIQTIDLDTFRTKAVCITIHTCNQIILTLLYSALFIQYGLVGIFIKLAGKILHRRGIKSIFH